MVAFGTLMRGRSRIRNESVCKVKKKYGNGMHRYSLVFRREDMGGPAHPWGRGVGGGSVHG
jgi:hypothetical protein